MINATVIYRFQCMISGRPVDCDMCYAQMPDGQSFFTILAELDNREIEYPLLADNADRSHFIFADDQVPDALKVAEYTLNKAIVEYFA